MNEGEVMAIIDELLAGLPDGPVREVRVGAHWTAVVVDLEGRARCGLASTLHDEGEHHHGGGPPVREAGDLTLRSGRELAELAHSDRPTEVSIGVAAINALLPRDESAWTDINAGDVLAEHGVGKHVALVGHFPFVPTLRERVARLSVLEQRPRGDDLPAEAAPQVIPQADLVAISGTALINGTLDGLLGLCRSDALVMVLGPSTPLSPILFEHGVDLLSGAVVEAIGPVLEAVSQAASFRQVHRRGVRLVTMHRPD
jgi:uncharacterized protein (DUF4213/DUF364 family)